MDTLLTYAAESCVAEDAIRLQPNLRRDAVEVRARVLEPLAFRDGLLALRDVVHSKLYTSREEIIAQLDPLITVSNHGVYFEAFSLDESTYAMMTVRKEGFEGLDGVVQGCTNIAFSRALEQGLRDIRSSRPTYLEVKRGGMGLHQEKSSVFEHKITLPANWMHGFLEVQAALHLPARRLTLAAVDFRNIVMYLKRHKAKMSPRSMRMKLAPGEPPQVTLEPWGEQFVCRQSRYHGEEPTEIRVWGRRRLLLLEKLLVGANGLEVRLQGSGMPSFWKCDLGAVSFVLGLSPWTARDWTSDETCHLMEGPAQVDENDRLRLLAYLEEHFSVSAEAAASALQMPLSAVTAAFNLLCLEGRALFDGGLGAYICRRVFDQAPPPPPHLSKREEEAAALAREGRVQDLQADGDGWNAVVRGRGGRYRARLQLDSGGRIQAGVCTCPFHQRFSALRGPCKHLLAVRLQVLSH